jgi:CheY-like chemotaxis protein
MRHRVQDILLVSSLYDSYILAADGQLDELILGEFRALTLRQTPSLTHVPTADEALRLVGAGARYDLVLTSMNVGEMSALALAKGLRTLGSTTPVVLLAYSSGDIEQIARRDDVMALDRIFLWQGDVRLLLAIVNDVEDRLNVSHDTGELGVQAVIVIEDNVRFYSSFLPAIYRELLHQSDKVAPEGVNLADRLMRAQARPKILLCHRYEEAWAYFSTYEENILGVVSDIEFPWAGRLRGDAGVEFARRVRERQPDVPVMLQSSRAENQSLAREVGAAFLLKNSPLLLHQLRQFMVDNFGFGEFVFRRRDGTEVGRAGDLRALEETLRSVPAESVAYHAEGNHFSRWLKARTEFALAHSLRPRQVSDFATIDGLRWHLVDAIHEYRRQRRLTTVADFDVASFDPTSPFSRIGGGSLGGKARGLAFVGLLLAESDAIDRFPDVHIEVPPSVVLGTDVFDEFLEANGLRDLAIESADEAALATRFLSARLTEGVRADLVAFLRRVDYPLAVRSSSLLEDSHYQPFAGVYDTLMLPNNHDDLEVRLAHLVDAIRLVYASMFGRRAKAYLSATPYRLEEEKMAVIVQKVVGAAHGPRFYPDFAGVARSHNFYPTAPMSSSDGVAAVALGLGAMVVEGEACVRFCPRFPQHQMPFGSAGDLLENSQREFYALRLDGRTGDGPYGAATARSGLDAAERDGTLSWLGSTYSPENDTINDGVSRPGVRLVSFAPILKHRLFPLAEILDVLLELGTRGTGGPVELEFAVNLSTPRDQPREFGFLQLRPLALARELATLDLGAVRRADLICQSTSVLGHGEVELFDIVVVDVHRFDRGRSLPVAQDLRRFNAALVAEKRPYLLIGVGRLGSRDPFLGIPVTWDQISGARTIVEAGFRDFRVTPSQGTHFFQNLCTSNVGYFTVNPEAGEGFIDWAWLAGVPAHRETAHVRHLRLSSPILIRMNGSRNEGVILKPEPDRTPSPERHSG